MAKRSIITNAGLSLLASSSTATGQYYWLGYYALAYVPNYWKTNTSGTPACPPSGVTAVPYEPLDYSMTNLTEVGDMIWNVFQGDMAGTGYAGGISDNSAGGDLFGLSMYARNVKKHYRYTLDTNGNNNLVTWVNDPNVSGMMLGATTYAGTDGFVSSTLPIPAPLYYLGDVTGHTSASTFFPSIAVSSLNGASIYRYANYTYGSSQTMEFPLVSADYRGYVDSAGNGIAAAYNYTWTGSQFDSFDISATISALGSNVESYFCAASTLVTDVSGGTTPSTLCKSLWKALSVSNYNRFHSTVGSLGNVLSSDLGSRNMAKTTKFFPIANYKVIDSTTGYTAGGVLREVASAISLTVDIDLAPNTKGPGSSDTGLNFDENSNLLFFDKYDRSSDVPGQPTIFNKTETSFKFNRIGLYAIPMVQAPYSIQAANTTSTTGTECTVQFQIDPDAEPVLFAVVDFDNTVYLSDTGDGLHRFTADFNVNFNSDSSVLDSSLVRDSVIFYNMYEDDALRWYQNQLITNASTQNAIIEFGLEVSHLKSQFANLVSKCCPPTNYDSRYALKSELQTVKTLRNLSDALYANDGGLKGVDTKAEGYTDSTFTTGYILGLDSVSLGQGTIVQANYSYAGGNTSSIYGTISGVASSASRSLSQNSFIGSAATSTIQNNKCTFIGTGINISFTGDNVNSYSYNGSVTGYGISVVNSSYVFIGTGHEITINGNGASYSNMLNGNNISYTVTGSGVSYVNVFNGANITLTGDMTESTILNGDSLTFNSSRYSVFGGISHSSAQNVDYAYMLAGAYNTMATGVGSAYLGIVGGQNNEYTGTCTYALMLNSQGSTVESSSNVFVVNGGGLTIFGTNIVSFGADSQIGFNAGLPNAEANAFIVGDGWNLYGGSYNSGFGVGSTIVNSTHSFTSGSNINVTNSTYAYLFGAGLYATYADYVSMFGAGSHITGTTGNHITSASILGGAGHTIATPSGFNGIAPSYSTILGGSQVNVTHYGEIAHGNGQLSSTNWCMRTSVIPDEVVYQSPTGGATVTPITILGPFTSKTKHSVFTLGGIIDIYSTGSWSSPPSGNPSIVTFPGTGVPTFTSDVNTNICLTLDGLAPVFDTGTFNYSTTTSILNSINLEKGQSMSGTVKFTVHIPFSATGTRCDGTTAYQSGAVFYSLFSFGAYRDMGGRVKMSSQLINESSASQQDLHTNVYGISTTISPLAEVFSSSNDTYGSGFYGPDLSADAPTSLEDMRTAYRIGLNDGYKDITDLSGLRGSLLFNVALSCTAVNAPFYYSSRYIFCSAVVDTVVITNSGAIYPS